MTTMQEIENMKRLIREAEARIVLLSRIALDTIGADSGPREVPGYDTIVGDTRYI